MDSNEVKKRDLYLIKSTLKGNNDAFAKLITHYKQRVLVFGKSFFHNETDAEDFVQDVFIKVFLNLKSFKGKSLFSTWLMKIAYTTAINSVNRRKEYLPIADNYSVKDLWADTDSECTDLVKATVPSHGVKVYRIKALSWQ